MIEKLKNELESQISRADFLTARNTDLQQHKEQAERKSQQDLQELKRKLDLYTNENNKIHLEKQPVWIEYLNSVKNLFNGYWVKENRRINKNKIKSLLKRVKRKLIK